MPIKQLTRIAMISALCVVLRFAFSSLPNVQPITAIFLVIAIHYSVIEAISVMAITMCVTGFLMGFTPVILWQILSFTLIILIWKYILEPVTSCVKFVTIGEAQWSIKGVLDLILTGMLSFLYGVQIDAVYAYLYHMPFFIYIGAGFTFNLAHAFSTALFYPIIEAIIIRLKQRSFK